MEHFNRLSKDFACNLYYEIILVDRLKFNFKDQSGIGRNVWWRPLGTVGQTWRTDQMPLTANLKTKKTFQCFNPAIKTSIVNGARAIRHLEKMIPTIFIIFDRDFLIFFGKKAILLRVSSFWEAGSESSFILTRWQMADVVNCPSSKSTKFSTGCRTGRCRIAHILRNLVSRVT